MDRRNTLYQMNYKRIQIEVLNLHIKDGKKSGYPACCIANFIGLLIDGFRPALYMDEVYRIDHGEDFVLCHSCHKDVIHDIEINGSYCFPTFNEYERRNIRL